MQETGTETAALKYSAQICKILQNLCWRDGWHFCLQPIIIIRQLFVTWRKLPPGLSYMDNKWSLEDQKRGSSIFYQVERKDSYSYVVVFFAQKLFSGFFCQWCRNTQNLESMKAFCGKTFISKYSTMCGFEKKKKKILQEILTKVFTFSRFPKHMWLGYKHRTF